MTKQELIEELNKTNSICGIEINTQQKQALRYVAIRMEQLDEIDYKQKDARIAELEKQLAIKDRALELASDVIKVICPPIAIGGIVPEHFNDTKDSEYFIAQAEKEIKGEK